MLSPDSSDSRLLTIQPVFPYFLKTKLETLNDNTRAALQDGFKNHYRDRANYYEQLMDSKDPQELQLGQLFCRLEYENLYNALQMSLEKQENISIFFCLDKYFQLTSNMQSKLSMAEIVCQGLEKYPPVRKEGELGYQVAMAVYSLATGYLDMKQYQLAKQSYERVLKIIQALIGTEERDKQGWIANTYHNLGVVAQELRDFKEAQRNYRKALDIKIGFDDHYACAPTYHQLGRVAQELRDFEEAQRNYRKALDIKIEFDDHYACAPTYHQLGRVAQELRDFEEAQRNYRKALDIKTKFDAHYACAVTYHNLGVVAQELRDFEEARRNYRKALDIKIEFDDHYAYAPTYHQLGRVVQELRDFEEARHNYRKALDIKIKFDAHYTCAVTYHWLGLLAEVQKDFSEARANWQKALEIYVEFKDEYRAGITRQLLEALPE